MTEAHGWLVWQVSIGRERGRHTGALQIIEEACERNGWLLWHAERGWSVTGQGQVALREAFIMDSSDPVEHARILVRGPLKRETREHVMPPLIQ